MAPLLEISDLKVHFFTFDGVIRAVDGVDLSVGAGEIVGIVGESGCGKSVTAKSLLGLVPSPGKIVSGEIRLDGVDIATLSEERMREVRGGRIGMIFQNPLTSLNPVFTVGEQIRRVIRIHNRCDDRTARVRASEMFSLVRLPDPNRTLKKYPHQLSGGQLQRVMIAMALSLKPALLIADEPTTALDVTIQAQILTLTANLRDETGAAVLLITHDLGVVSEICETVVVMYAGNIVEAGPASDLFSNPRHPYTQGLLASLPGRMNRGRDFPAIPGTVPDMRRPPAGCRFHPRCPEAQPACEKSVPPMRNITVRRRVACHMRESETDPGEKHAKGRP